MQNRWKNTVNIGFCLLLSACFSSGKGHLTPTPTPAPSSLESQNKLQEFDSDSYSGEPIAQDPGYAPAHPPEVESEIEVEPNVIEEVRKPYLDSETGIEPTPTPSREYDEPTKAKPNPTSTHAPKDKPKKPDESRNTYSLIEVRRDFYSDQLNTKDFIKKYKDRNLVADLNQIQLATALEKFSGKSQSLQFCPPSVTPRCNSLHIYVPAIALGNNTLNSLLIHLHGGGPATRTPKLAADIAERDLNIYKNWADKTGTIIATPSTDFEWQEESAFIVEDLILAIQKELPIHPDRIYLAGQSMGALAIGKTFPFLTNKIAGFLSLIGKISEEIVAQNGLLVLFNAPYIQSNGLNDPVVADNTAFIKSKLKDGMKFHEYNHEKGHEISAQKVGAAMNTLFNYARKPYQIEIYSNFIQMHRNEEIIPCYDVNDPKIRYLLRRPKVDNKRILKNHWLEIEGVPTFSSDKTASFSMHAKVEDNKITIRSENLSVLSPTKLIVYLSKKTINFNEPISIELNGESVFYERLSPSNQVLIENAKRAKDPHFRFEQRVVIPLKPKQVSSLHKWKLIAA